MKKIILILMTILLISCGKEEEEEVIVEKKEVQFKSVKTEDINFGKIQNTSKTSGELDVVDKISEKTPGGGEIVELNFSNGQWVNRGDVIMRISNTNASTMYVNAKARYSTSLSEYETQKAKVERFRVLYNEGHLSLNEFEQMTNGLTAVENAMLSAQADMLNAEKSLNDFIVTAKISGTLADLEYKLHEQTKNEGNLFSILDESKMNVTSGVSSADIGSIKIGDSFKVKIDGMSEDFYSKVYEINPVADPATKKFSVKSLIDNSSRKLKKGMYAEITINGASSDAYTVPTKAIVIKELENYIFVAEKGEIDGKSVDIAKRIQVKLGNENGDFVQVESEYLKEGMKVITEGQFLLEDGTPIKFM